MSFTGSSHSLAKNRTIYGHVMCFGTFDIFHPGHEYYLGESAKLAKAMTIVIARDHRVFSGKGRDPIHDELSRMEIVREHFPLAEVILGHSCDIFAPIRERAPDLLSFGYDQRVPEEKLQALFPAIDIVRIEAHEPDKHKSSILREKISK